MPVAAKPAHYAFLKAFLAWMTIFAGMYLLVVAVIDPRGQFLRLGWFPEVRPNNRGAKVELFDKYHASKPVEGLLLGSSRSMGMSPALLTELTGMRFFNAAVFAGAAEDYLSLYRVLHAKAPSIQWVLLCAEPLALHPEDEFATDLEGNFTLREAVEPGLGPPFVRRISFWAHLIHEQFTTTVVSESTSAFRQGLAGWTEIQHMLPDGRMIYTDRARRIALGTFDLAAGLKGLSAHVEGRLSGYVKLSEKRRGYVEQLLVEARKDGVRIDLWIPPTHPYIYQDLSRKPVLERRYLAAIDYYRGLAGSHGVTVLDLSRIENYRGDPEAWYDGLHFRPSENEKIARRLAELTGP